MPFTNPDFPGQVFSTVGELQDASDRRLRVENDLARRTQETEDEDSITKVTAIVIPTPREVLERRVILLEQHLKKVLKLLETKESEDSKTNNDNLPIGMVLKGESKGKDYTLEVLDKGYLCSTGEITTTLSAAAEAASGNRRSGWAFWKDMQGIPIGEITGRFKKRDRTNAFGAL